MQDVHRSHQAQGQFLQLDQVFLYVECSLLWQSEQTSAHPIRSCLQLKQISSRLSDRKVAPPLMILIASIGTHFRFERVDLQQLLIHVSHRRDAIVPDMWN